jgi:predicted Co/Zn/Cd cation transporter (cation efflux family)
MELFRGIDLLLYSGFACSTIGWGLNTLYPRLSAILNIIGGILGVIFGHYINSMAIMIVNGIWAAVSAFNLNRLEMKRIEKEREEEK